MRLREIIRASESKPIDTGKNSDSMRILCNSVVSLSWRAPTGSPAEVCHWVDGSPLNLHLYISLLHSIYDIKDETMVLDEVDELLELMKKTWSTLGINRPLHNLCFTWVLFHQYVATGQTEPDLLCAAFSMLAEVANDAKKPDRDSNYVKFLSAVLASIKSWSEKRLVNYHEYFHKGIVGMMENLLPVVLSATKILNEDITARVLARHAKEEPAVETDHAGNRVDYYIRSSVRNAFSKVIDHLDFSCQVVIHHFQ